MSQTRRNPRASKAEPLFGVGLAVAFLLLGACSTEVADRPSSAPAAEAASPTISWTHFDVPEPPTFTAELAATGEQVFDDNCASCHGSTGAADGVCAAFLIPAAA